MSNLKSIIKYLLSQTSVSTCANCSYEVSHYALLCESCKKNISTNQQNSLLPYLLTRNINYHFKYDEHSKGIIKKIKFSSIKKVESILSIILMQYIDASISQQKNITIIPVPTNQYITNIREKKHLVRICQMTSHASGERINYQHVLKLKPSLHNKILPQSKFENKISRLYIQRNFIIPKNNKIILIDDVSTTGSMIRACVQKLLEYDKNLIDRLYTFCFFKA